MLRGSSPSPCGAALRPPQGGPPAGLPAMRARASQRSPPSASASRRKEVTLRAPGRETSRHVFGSQAALAQALASLDCKGGWLVEDSSQARFYHYADLRDGATYSVQPQVGRLGRAACCCCCAACLTPPPPAPPWAPGGAACKAPDP